MTLGRIQLFGTIQCNGGSHQVILSPSATAAHSRILSLGSRDTTVVMSLPLYAYKLLLVHVSSLFLQLFGFADVFITTIVA